MKDFIICLSFIFTYLTTSYGQVDGKVLCGNNPLNKVHIYFKNSSIGTISNSQGNFILKIDSISNQKFDSIVFSSIGFETKTLHKNKLDSVIKLKKLSKELDEISVFPFSAKEMIWKCIDNFEKNFYFKSVLTKYKRIHTLNDTVQKMLLIDLLIKEKKKQPKVYLKKSYINKIEYFNYFENETVDLFEENEKQLFEYIFSYKSLLKDFMTFIYEKQKDSIDIKISNINFQNCKAYQIVLITSNQTTLNIVLSANNFSLIHFNYRNSYFSQKNKFNYLKNENIEIKTIPIFNDLTIGFRKKHKQWLPAFISTNITKKKIIKSDLKSNTYIGNSYRELIFQNYSSKIKAKRKLNLNIDLSKNIKLKQTNDLRNIPLTQKEKEFLLSK